MRGDIYYLDRDLNRLDIIEEYISFIWAVRYDEHGSFTLKLPTHSVDLARIRTAFFLEFTASHYLMMIESIFYDKEAGEVTISGDSVEAMLKHRLVMSNWTSGTQHDEWRYSARSPVVASMLVDRFVISGADTIPQDVLPHLVKGSTAWGGDTISVALKSQNLYDALKNICAIDDMGFRIVFRRNETPKQLRFDVIRGIDRTVSNTERPAVLFKNDIGSLAKNTYLDSIVDYKSTGYVLSDGKMIQVVHNGQSMYGWDRRIEAFDASQYSTSSTTRYRQIQSEMVDKRKVELADGEVESGATLHKYMYNFEVGDIVTIESMEGAKTQSVRISEYTHSYDQEGFKEFPTFRPVRLD